MHKGRREMFAGAAVAAVLLASGCGLGGGGRTAPAGNAVQPAGGSKSAGPGNGTDPYGADGYGADAGYGAGGGSGSGEGGAGEAGGSGANPAGGAPNGPAGKLTARDVPGLGPVVSDGKGWTLYRFDKDTAQPPASTCDGDCAKAWPPVPAADASAVGAVDAALLGEVVRSDGTRQLTLSGWPVYRYAKDTKPGEARGEGVGGTWHAFAPDGRKAADKKAGTADGAGQGGSGGSSPVAVSRDPELGNILVDGSGNTLYRFDKDSAWPMKIGCLGSCLDSWKPAEAVDAARVTGIPQELIGSVKRPDGSTQLTIDCWPVYRFTGDKKPGDVTGHGKQGLWWAVTDTGKKAPAA
ncbi:SCO0930 family lipoprotein [Streptomyces antimicrobicus]|uniref:SCO0930 family lipoprotein n=1 Tax=Streptomyces antimicrobicus TaxID=2883108 RepID=A0ABS8BE74_9ACTN|nr:SCO0930 family lipoprotein [Streptomyces antimicrobicus]MCB5182806.1 SCO0930 family lipoprotein [Streptomyces antimicrobicus]